MKQTAIDYLYEQFISIFMQYHEEDVPTIDFSKIITEAFEKAKEMEKQQIMKAARQCHFEGLRQSGKNSEEYIAYGKQYYNENYTNDN